MGCAQTHTFDPTSNGLRGHGPAPERPHGGGCLPRFIQRVRNLPYSPGFVAGRLQGAS